MSSSLHTVGHPFIKPALLQASPEMTRLVADYDWSSTPLGPIEHWSSALRNTVDNMLATGSALLLWWGPSFVQIYNDAYRPILGDKHPKALGQPVSECWNEIAETIVPLIETPFNGGPPSVLEDLDLTLQRRGYAEEAHFTVAYSPVFDDATLTGIGGVMATVYETTERLISDRRMRLLRALATRTAEAQDPVRVCEIAAEALSTDPQDVPYAAFYLCDYEAGNANLTAVAGSLRSPQSPWPKTVATAYDDFPVERSEVALPIRSTGSKPWGFVVAGTSHRLPVDEKYLDFLEMVAAPISTSLNKVHAYTAERERAEALAELDRAKSAFFSNVSHELRTPLTLILGPLEELTNRSTGEQLALLEASQRNALRLLKLVNSLLDFSRLESGHQDAAFVETDLAALTVDLCSVFRSAIEGAGLALEVDVGMTQTAFVDRSMWEKIVLNLLSNALKFTMRGEIHVLLGATDGFAELTVRDTGTGIDPRDRQKIFERFHRSRPSEARSHEGSGIGLALVSELVRIHGGTVTVESEVGKGSAFFVRLPLGSDHLPANLIKSAVATESHVVQYLADIAATVGTIPSAPVAPAGTRARILLVDDNVDLRRYIAHLLGGHYDLATAADGREALERLETESFDLVLTDVMMPQMDGAELLAAMRADPLLAATPVIMLSARAGEESSVEMLRGGAVDYLVKPFSAAQLLTRVGAQLEARKQWIDRTGKGSSSERAFRSFADALPIMMWRRDATGALTFTNAQWHRVVNLPYHSSSWSEERWRDMVHPDDYDRTVDDVGEAVKHQRSYETEYRLKPAGSDHRSYRWYLSRGVARFDEAGVFQGWTGWTIDLHEARLREETERRLAAAAQQGERDFHELVESIPVMLWIADETGARKWYNARWYEFTGQTPEEASDWGWQSVHPAHDLQRIMRKLPKCVASGEPFEMKVSLRRFDGQYRKMLMRAVAERDADGRIVRWYGCATDIQYQHDALERSQHVADVLKDILLPNELPSDERLHVDGIYQSPSEEELVGGDWFDAMHLPDGRMLISIGDVAGHGLEASVLAARLRHAMIDYSLDSENPSEVLESVNRVIRAQYPDRFATAVLGFIDPTFSQLTYACAGHFPPVMAHASAAATHLPYSGLPLGVQDTVTSVKHVVGLPPRTVLAFYTDGIVEFENDMPLAEERLKIAVSGLVNKNVAKPAQVVRDAVMMGAPSRDDAALLVLCFTDNPAVEAADDRARVMSWRFHSSDAQTVGRSRTIVMRFLEQFSKNQDELFGAELVIGEALSNTFKHAPGIVEVEVDCRGQRPVVVLSDTGPGIGRITRRLPDDDLDERGRGLFIAQALAHDVSALPPAGGGTRLRIALNVTLTDHQPTDSPSLPKSDPAL